MEESRILKETGDKAGGSWNRGFLSLTWQVSKKMMLVGVNEWDLVQTSLLIFKYFYFCCRSLKSQGFQPLSKKYVNESVLGKSLGPALIYLTIFCLPLSL